MSSCANKGEARSIDSVRLLSVSIFDEDGVPTPTWQIDASVYPSELVVPLYVRDRLGLRTRSTVPALTPSVQALPNEALADRDAFSSLLLDLLKPIA